MGHEVQFQICMVLGVLTKPVKFIFKLSFSIFICTLWEKQKS